MTVPLVFLRTDAAKFWVTPTRLVPSTSTIKSFTWILPKGKRTKITAQGDKSASVKWLGLYLGPSS